MFSPIIHILHSLDDWKFTFKKDKLNVFTVYLHRGNFCRERCKSTYITEVDRNGCIDLWLYKMPLF